MAKTLLNLPDDLAAEVEAFRAGSGMKTTSEAIRSLIRSGLMAGIGLNPNRSLGQAIWSIGPDRDDYVPPPLAVGPSAFERIKAGLEEAIQITEGKAEPGRIHYPPLVSPSLVSGPVQSAPGSRLKTGKKK